MQTPAAPFSIKKPDGLRTHDWCEERFSTDPLINNEASIEMAIPEQSLTEQAEAIRQAVQASDGRSQPPAEIRAVSLASFFYYNVTQGGFAQLVYNAQGEYLAEIEDMLIAANARIAADFYVRSIEMCLADKQGYQEFLAGDFITESALKNALHGLSVEYLRGGPSFVEEADSFIQASRPVVERWVMDQRKPDA